jgi:hypothetical protein
MNALVNRSVCRTLISVLTLTAVFILSGCTSIVWDKRTFSSYCRPANPTKLELYYSSQRKDILVRYNEFNEHNSKIQHRSYWLMANAERVSAGRKPHFLDERDRASLSATVVSESPGGVPLEGMGAVARQDEDVFTLYSESQKLDPYSLPIYQDPNRRAKQIALTPVALTIDASLIGAALALYNAPQILAALSR